MRRCALAGALLVTAAACGDAREQPSGDTGAAQAQARIACALEGDSEIAATCSLERIDQGEDRILVVGRDDAGFRRLRITRDGRGVETADGAHPAEVTIIDDGLIEVRVDSDRYHLAANTGGK